MKILNFLNYFGRKFSVRIFRKRFLFLSILLALIFLFSGFLFWSEFTGRIDGLVNNHPSLSFLSRVPKILDIYYLPLMIKGPDLPRYKLTINKDDLKDLERVLASINGLCCNCLPKEATKYTSATFEFQNKSYPVEVRVRGDCANHWSNTKKSWRIRFKDGDFFGLAEFDLILPDDREYIAEYLNNYRAKKLGLAVPEFKLVTLKINGAFYGPYIQQEPTDGKMLEKNRQAADVNVYSDQKITDQLFKDPNAWQKDNQDKISLIDNYAEINLLLDLINNASDEEFFAKIPYLVDLDNFYKWSALNMLAGSYHQDFAHNMRIYFDSTIGKFKFIPSDVGLSNSSVIDIVYNPLVTRIIKNSEFLDQRNQVLWDYVKNEQNLTDDLAFFDQAYDDIRFAVYRDRKTNYSSFYFDRKLKIRRQRFNDLFHEAQDLLNDGKVSVAIDFSENLESQINSLAVLARIEFLVNNFSGVELNELKINLNQDQKIQGTLSLYFDRNKNGKFDNDDSKLGNFTSDNQALIIDNFNQRMLADREISQNIDYNVQDYEAGVGPLMKPIQIINTKYNFFIVANNHSNLSSVEVFNNLEFDINNAVTGKKMSDDKVYIDSTTFNNFNDLLLSQSEFLRKFPQFKMVGQSLVLPSGVYRFDKNIIIPKCFDQWIISAGAVLEVGPEVSIFSYIPLKAAGTAQNPIVIHRLDNTKPWGVVAVIGQEDKTSQLENVSIGGGSQAYVNGIFVSGQISFYHSDVIIKNSVFYQASGDDSLNIKDAIGEVYSSIFHSNGFDAFDFDFAAKGSLIEGNQFYDNGNDGIDISGSSVLIKDNKILSSGDKCISVGENSTPKILSNLLKGCNIGIAVKDLSESEIIQNTIIDNKDSGVFLYQKKEIFGKSSARLDKNIIWNNLVQIKTEDNSSVDITNSDIQGGFAGEGNFSLEPEFDSNFVAKNLEIGFGK